MKMHLADKKLYKFGVKPACGYSDRNPHHAIQMTENRQLVTCTDCKKE